MIEHKKRKIQPYRASDGDVASLLEFGYKALARIDTGFEKPLSENPVEKESEPYEYDIMKYLYGTPSKEIRISYKIGYEPKYGGHAEDRVILEVIGLSNGMAFELECTRYYHDPRFLEICLSLPK
ncbi:MAG: hypothetical protein P1Q69_15720 [Candidatus Thorarchaeota archaeon]|nr:hypothetical protein [Candidatus Thorarchaeota archaeon]